MEFKNDFKKARDALPPFPSFRSLATTTPKMNRPLSPSSASSSQTHSQSMFSPSPQPQTRICRSLAVESVTHDLGVRSSIYCRVSSFFAKSFSTELIVLAAGLSPRQPDYLPDPAPLPHPHPSLPPLAPQHVSLPASALPPEAQVLTPPLHQLPTSPPVLPQLLVLRGDSGGARFGNPPSRGRPP